jgi:hypothetical protein
VVVPPPYYGGYYGGYGYYDNDWMFGMAVGTTMVIGAAAVASSDDDDDETTIINTTTAPATQATLPCNPAVSIVEGVTYYQCGPQYFVQAYGGTGPIYMPVSPPAGAAAPAPVATKPPG